MLTVDEALAQVLDLARPMDMEEVPLRQAAGRWLAQPVAARRTQPPFAASAMDGYALPCAARIGASFAVVGEAGAGHGWAGRLADGQALRIFTGAPVPSGGVWVIPQEDVTREGDHITVTREGSANIRAAGDDFGTGWQLRPRLLSPADLALLAAMNIDRVPVRKRPEVAIICTGDELVMPGEEPGPDQIIASNGFALAAMVERVGGVARMLPIAQDRVESLGAVFELARGADVVVTVGGASVGEHDVVAKAAEGLGLERRFWKIAMRPGKPLIAGRIFGVPMLGMPGNPVSAIVCAQLFLLPLLRVMQGDPAPAPRYLRAELAVDDGPAGPRTHFMRATLADGPGLPLITPCSRQDSALLTVLADAQVLLVRPAGDGPRHAGEIVPYLPL